MPTVEYPAEIRITIRGTQRPSGQQSQRRKIITAMLAGAALVLLYLHTAAEPKVQLSANEIEFAPVSVSASTASKQIAITNAGGAVLHIDQIGINGDAADEYQAQTDCSRSTIEPQQTCVVEVSLRPGEEGRRLAELVIPNDSDEKVARVRLLGMGVRVEPPDLTAEPVPLVFQQPVNVSMTQPVILHSTGKAAAVISSITTSDQLFSASQDCVGKQLNAEEPCVVGVTFAPTEAVTGAATLTVVFTGDGADHTLQVPINGSAVGPDPVPPPPLRGVLQVDPPDASFTRDQRGPTTVTVSNIGDGLLPITSIGVTKGADKFEISKECAGKSELKAGEKCRFTVFPTTSEPGQWVGTLLVTTPDDAKTIPLSASIEPAAVAGIGLSARGLRVWKNVTQEVAASSSNPNTLIVESTGDAPLRIDFLEFDSSQFRKDDSAGGSCVEKTPMSRGQRCVIRLVYVGDAPVTKGRMLIHDNVAGSPQTVVLAGIGEKAAPAGRLEVSGNGEFPNTEVGNVGAVLLAALFRVGNTFVVKNTGGTAVTISRISIRGNGSSSFNESDNCKTPLAPEQACTVKVGFHPVSEGDQSASLTIENDGLVSPASVALHGLGTNRAPKPQQPPPERTPPQQTPAAPTGLKATVAETKVTPNKGRRAMERVPVTQPPVVVR